MPRPEAAVSSRDALAKGSFYYFDPDKLTLVTDETHPLYDPRAKEKPDEALVMSMFKFGFRTGSSVEVEGDESGLLVVDGRRRVLAARECKRRQIEAGENEAVLIRVRCIFAKGGTPFTSMILGNAHRKDETLLQKAAKAQRSMNMGNDAKETAAIFGVSQQTISNWLAVLAFDAPLAKALELGQISMSNALDLAKKTPEERAMVLSTAHVSPIRGANGKAAVRKPSAEPVSTRMSSSQMRAFLHHLRNPEEGKMDTNAELAAGVIAFVLGDDATGRRLSGYDSVKAAAKMVRG